MPVGLKPAGAASPSSYSQTWPSPQNVKLRLLGFRAASGHAVHVGPRPENHAGEPGLGLLYIQEEYGAGVASMRLPQVPDSSVQAVIGRVARVIEKAFLRLPIEVEPGG